MLYSSIDWTNVIVAAIAVIPSVISALIAVSVRRQIRMPSGGTIGEIVEKGHHTGIANNLLLRVLNGQTMPAPDMTGIPPEDLPKPEVPKE